MAARCIAVAGGGLAGLSAAVALTRAGCDVTLFERSRLLGGKATSFEIEGMEVDNGQHVYLACCTEFVDFVDSLNRDEWGGESPLTLQHRFDSLLLSPGKPAARLHAARLPAPLHLGPALLGYGHLPLSARLGLGRAVAAAYRPPRRGETFAGWLARHGQGAASRKAFWDPFLIPALNAPLEEVAAEDALFVIRTAFLNDAGGARFGYARVPLGQIAEVAGRELGAVNRRSAVAGLALDGSGHACGVLLEDGAMVPADGIVLAVPPSRLLRILGDAESFGVHGLDRFQTVPIVDVHLWYDGVDLPFDFAALLGSPVQWVFRKGPGYACCSMSAAAAHQSVPNAELIEMCDRELRAVIPALGGGRVRRGAATRDRDATFVPAPGLRRPGPLTREPNVVIAGAWTDTGWPATMESAVRSGRAAARALRVQMESERTRDAA
jgi:squalene-associated FAD-dependent desaturase